MLRFDDINNTKYLFNFLSHRPYTRGLLHFITIIASHESRHCRIMPPTGKNWSGDKPFPYSQTRTAIASRARRAAKKAELRRVPAKKIQRKIPAVDPERQGADIKQEFEGGSPEPARGTVTAPSLARNVAKKSVMPGGYSQTKDAIASRERRAGMTPKVRKEMLKRQASYNATKRAKNTTGNEEGSEDLSNAEQQIFPGNEEVRVTQERYVVSTSIPSSPSNALTVPLNIISG